MQKGRDVLGSVLGRSQGNGPTLKTVVNYRKWVEGLIATHGKEQAMSISVGGNFTAFGQIEASLLVSLGLKAGQMVVDVGCGSGRMATVLSKPNAPDIGYHGTDIVAASLEHAQSISRPGFRFTLVDGLTIPEADNVADFITFFSVMTHLTHAESYLYLAEALRVLKPGGRAVVSYIELAHPRQIHWPVFARDLEHLKNPPLLLLNQFIETPVLKIWADHLGFAVEDVLSGEDARIPIAEPFTWDSGMASRPSENLGQSAIILRKPG
jgi:SAM-dependent methyltransferase